MIIYFIKLPLLRATFALNVGRPKKAGSALVEQGRVGR